VVGVAAFKSFFYSARRGQGKLELSECSTPGLEEEDDWL